MWNRRAALDGLARILEAGAPEELFAGPGGDAALLYQLLVDAARGREAVCYGEICRMARRRGVTPEYVVDRAVVLLAAMRERRRADLYRVLGVPPLAPAETIRQRFLEVAKADHPDAGGDGARFRRAKQAYEVLRDPGRRAEYERFWIRALGPFERFMAAAEVAEARPAAGPVAPAAPAAAPEPLAGLALVGEVLARIEALLAPLRRDDLERLAGEVQAAIRDLEALQDDLATVAALKRRLAV